MASLLNPYLSFRDNAREAMEFYHAAFGGELTVSTFGEYGMEGPMASLVMHAQLQTPSGYTLMAADTPPEMGYVEGSRVAVSLSGDDADELRGHWARLSEGGTVDIPLEKQMWGDEFGQCVDRFGVSWLVNIAGSSA